MCIKVSATHGVVAYLGRSGVLPNLLNAMQSACGQCQPPEGTTIPLIAESARLPAPPRPHGTNLPVYDTLLRDHQCPDAGLAGSLRPVHQDSTAVFGRLSADGGFDTVGIVSKVIENLLPASQDVRPNDIYLWLTAHGVSQYPGASSVLQRDAKNKYPPDKAVYIREITQPRGTLSTLLSCGILPDRQNRTTWDTAPDTFPCPRKTTGSPTD